MSLISLITFSSNNQKLDNIKEIDVSFNNIVEEIPSWQNYSYKLLKTYKNPTHLRITYIDEDGNKGYHAVLGVGCANVRSSGRFMITHYDWWDENIGNYYVNESEFVYSLYIGAK